MSASANAADARPLPCVLLLIDWENVFYSLCNKFGAPKTNINARFRKLMEWVETELGDLLGGHGFIFAPSHFTAHHREMCAKHNLDIVICPKRKADDGSGEDKDTVDETIIRFGKMMMGNPNIDIICLVSGDEDFIPLLEEAKKRKVKVALVPPTLNSLSTSQAILKFVDKHPKTGKKMLLMLDQVLDQVEA